MLSLGVYPDVSLKLARKRRAELREQVANGADPSSERKAAKRAFATTFEMVARRHQYQIRIVKNRRGE